MRSNDSSTPSGEINRPWLPAPWCVQPHGPHVGAVWTGDNPDTHGNPLCEVHRPRSGVGATDWLAGSAYMRLADAELVALAPLMAEAIIEQFRRYPDCDIVRDLAPRLLAIGGPSIG